MSGFMQIYKTCNKSTEEALLKLREWGANSRFPLLLITDSGPAFRNNFVEECAKMGVWLNISLHIIHQHSLELNARWQSKALAEEVSKHEPIAVIRDGVCAK